MVICSLCKNKGHNRNNRKFHTKEEVDEYNNKILVKKLVGNIFKKIIKAHSKMEFTNDINEILSKNKCKLIDGEVYDSKNNHIGDWDGDNILDEDGEVIGDINRLFKNSGLDNENYVGNKFNTNDEYKKQFNKIREYSSDFISEKPIQSNGHNIKCLWCNKKRECNTVGSDEKFPKPKTDIIFKNNNISDRISFKMGEGRATSCAAAEYFCIIDSVYEEYFKDNENYKDGYDKLIEIFETMKKRGKHPVNSKERTKRSIKDDLDRKKVEKIDLDSDEKWVDETEKKCNEMNEKWKEVKEKYPNFIYSIIFECLSGQLKFGDNIGRADWLVITENKSTNIKKIIELNRDNLRIENSDINNYIKKYLDKNKNPFNFKSSGTGTPLYVRFF